VRIIELSLRNYRVFEEVDLELPPRVIGIFGQNGSGKSTLLESMAFACYGVDAARTKKQEIRTHGVLTDCEVRLLFEHSGQEYEVRRSIAGKNHTPDADLFVGGMQLAKGATPVTEEIQKLLRMDLHVFRASVFAEQKQLDAFSSMRKGERKEMVRRLLGIKPVDRAVDAARDETRAKSRAAADLERIGEDLPELETKEKEARAKAKEAAARAKEARATLRGAEQAAKAAAEEFDSSDLVRQQVEQLTLQIQASTKQRDDEIRRRNESLFRLDTLVAELEALPALEEELSRLEGVTERLHAARELAKASGTLQRLNDELDALPSTDMAATEEALRIASEAVETARNDNANAQAAARQATVILAESQERLARAADADPSEPCPTCGRELGDEFDAYRKHCEDEEKLAKRRASDAEHGTKAAAKVVSSAERDLTAKKKAHEEARRASETAARLVAGAEECHATVAALRELFAAEEPDIEMLVRQVDRERELRTTLGGLRIKVVRHAELEEDVANAEKRIAEHETALHELVGQAADLSFDHEAHAQLRAARLETQGTQEKARKEERSASSEAADAAKIAERLKGQLEQARDTLRRVEELRDEARMLDRVAHLLGGFRDHLVARIGPELSHEAEALFRELTDREYDDLKIAQDDLSIRIADGDAYFPIERFSGSEIDLANLALRVAISAHLSRVSGADVGLMVLDEVLGSLDQERKDLMVQAMGRLSARFHQLFVITHAEQVKEQFPASVIVRKVGRRRSAAELV
jgi:exonuclease SbcC